MHILIKTTCFIYQTMLKFILQVLIQKAIFKSLFKLLCCSQLFKLDVKFTSFESEKTGT